MKWIRLAAGALIVSASVVAAIAQTANRNPDLITLTEEARQSEAVKRRFADVALALDAPSLKPGHQGFTNDAELAGFLDDLTKRSQRVRLINAGKSQQGRDLNILLFTAEGRASLADARALNRPVLWFIGQQHGNEPAGGESMLALAAELAKPESARLLAAVTVVIVPRANPDGAANFTRGGANRADLNRDHLLMFQPEILALNRAMAQLRPDVVFDHHEFSVVNRWIEKYQAVQAVDAMVLHATNPMVPREISSLAEELYRPAVEQALKAKDLRMFWYYTTSNRRSDPVVSMGGNNPGIARNAFGLRGAVSFLIETRGVGIRRDGWQRRVATHVLAAQAVIEASVANAERLRSGIDAGRQAAAKAEADLVLAARIPANPLTIPLLDPETGADKPIEVPFQDSRVIQPTNVRPRAGGYVVLAGDSDAVERLALLGVRLCRIDTAVSLNATFYQLDSVRPPADRESINPDAAIKATLVKRDVTLQPGMLFVPMAQPAAGIVAATMEPDTPGSYVSVGLIPIPPDATEAPVVSIPRGARLPLRPNASDDATVCGS